MPEIAAPQAELPLPPAVPAAPKRFELPAEPKPEVPAASDAPKADAQNTGDEATPAKPEGEKPEEVTPEQAAKREGRRFERRLDKAYRQRAEAQAEAEVLRKQIAALQQPKAPEGEPKLEQFDYDPEKYAAAKAEFAKSQATKDFEAKQRADAGKQSQQRLVSAWEEKVERGIDKYDDWQDVVGDLQPTNAVLSAIMEAENGEDIAHYLGKNAKEAKRIAELPVVSQIREIGKLEAKLLSEPVKPKAPSKAPAPITPLTGAANVASDQPSDQDDMKSWMRKRQKQVHGKQ